MDTGGIAGDRLKSIVERIERLNEELKALNQDKTEIFAQAKASGFDPKIIKIIIKRRRTSQYELDLEDHMVGLYERAIAEADDSETGTHEASRVHPHASSRQAGMRRFGEEQATPP